LLNNLISLSLSPLLYLFDYCKINNVDSFLMYIDFFHHHVFPVIYRNKYRNKTVLITLVFSYH
ncbi:hypothetical protein V2733_14525, partial [Tenacibaculum maritimum]